MEVDVAGVSVHSEAGPEAPSIVQLLHNDRLSAHVDLPVAPDRASRAQAAIGSLVAGWRLPELRSRHWLASAADVLESPQPLEMFVQLDHVSHIVTLELWQQGALVFGIDDWVGF